jgi:prepilin peptidase CpaA
MTTIIADSAALTAAVLFVVAMVWAALSDLTTLTISNRLVMMIALGYALFAPAAGLGLGEIGAGIAVALAVLVVGFALFAGGFIVGGDAKLAAATVLWLGAGNALAYLVYVCLFGGAAALILIAFRRIPLPPVAAGHGWIVRLHESASGMPYGVALAAAALVMLPRTDWLAAAFV